MLLVALTSVAYGEPLSVKEFQDKLQGWKAEGKSPPPLPFEVEGRVSLYSKDRLRLFGLKDPPVLFLSKSELPDLARKWATVTGKIRVDSRSGDYTFDISSAKESRSDLERFHEKRSKIRSATASDWYELGRWAEIRGQFYQNDGVVARGVDERFARDVEELLSRGADAYRHGIEIERKARAKDDDVEGLFELAKKANEFRLPLADSQELIHEACHLLVQQSLAQQGSDLADLARQLGEKLPGVLDPAFISTDLARQYQNQAVATYAAADPATRRKLHRLLYTGVLMKTISAELADDALNGSEVADKIDKLVPEQYRLAEEYRDRALNARAKEPEKLTRSQVLDLAEQYRIRGSKRRGEQLLDDWLTLRLNRLDPDDTEGLLEVTEEYRRLLKRNDLADRLLIDAWKRNPHARDVAERLEKAGYRLFEGTWLAEEEFSNRPEGQMEQFIRAGVAKRGMTSGQVRRSRGNPDSFARAVSAGQVTELWSYTLSDGSRLVVRFVKKTGQPEAIVADVAQVRTP
jgi:hypothetical protein